MYSCSEAGSPGSYNTQDMPLQEVQQEACGHLPLQEVQQEACEMQLQVLQESQPQASRMIDNSRYCDNFQASVLLKLWSSWSLKEFKTIVFPLLLGSIHGLDIRLLYNNSYFTFRSWQGKMVN